MTDALPPDEGLCAQYAAALTAYGVEFERLSPVALAFVGDAECGTCEATLEFETLESAEAVKGEPVASVLVQAAFELPDTVIPAARQPAIDTLLRLLGPDIAFGAFEVDARTESIVYRLPLLQPAGATLPEGFLMGPLLEGLNIVDEAYDLFLRVIVDGDDPGHVYAERALSRRAEAGLPFDATQQARMLDLLQQASGRYLAQQYDAGLEVVATLVRRLTSGAP